MIKKVISIAMALIIIISIKTINPTMVLAGENLEKDIGRDVLINQVKEKSEKQEGSLYKKPTEILKVKDNSSITLQDNVTINSVNNLSGYLEEEEPNDSIELAGYYTLDLWMDAYMDYYDMDFYRFDATKCGTIQLDVISDYLAEYYLGLYNQYGEVVGAEQKEFGDDESYILDIAPGTYYLAFIEPDYNYNYYYTFKMYYSETYVQNVKLNKTTLNLALDKSEKLTAKILPSDATNQYVRWTSSNPSVASVDKNGVVKGNSLGTATISVYTDDGNYMDSCKVNVSIFSDIPQTHWAYKQVDDLASKNIIKGYSDGSFRPGDNITRAHAAVMIVNALGLDHKAKGANFSDVSSGHWAAGHIAAAQEAGIINGYSDGTFRPGENITRAQIAVMITKAYKLNDTGVKVNFGDVSQNHWAQKYIEVLASNGIINGYKDGNFGPGDLTTRAHFSVVLSNAIKKK